MENDTIVAIATPHGVGALSVIRMSGEKSFIIFKKSIREKEKEIKNRFAHNFFIKDKKNLVIDEVIAIHYKNPKTYTGEDIVEIICHGGTIIEEKIIEGKFQQELYSRIRAIAIEIPPLRRRKDDLPMLCHYFLGQLNKDLGKKIKKSRRLAGFILSLILPLST